MAFKKEGEKRMLRQDNYTITDTNLQEEREISDLIVQIGKEQDRQMEEYLVESIVKYGSISSY